MSTRNCCCGVARCGSGGVGDALRTPTSWFCPHPQVPPQDVLAPHHCLINRIGGLVGEDTGGQAGDHLASAHLEGCMQDIVIDMHVLPLQWVAQVGQAAYEGPRLLPASPQIDMGAYLGSDMSAICVY